MKFRDRSHAGRVLAELLKHYADRPNVVVLGLPRGGVPVAFEVAQALAAPLDVFVVRKIGVPGHEELAMGAVAGDGIRVLNDSVIGALGIDEDGISRAAAVATTELGRRERAYRDDRGPIEISGQTVILVDDGHATGSTMQAAARAVRAQDPEHVVVAVPVAPEETCEALRSEVDEIVCAFMPESLGAIGLWYDVFEQTSDEEVRDLLDRSRAYQPADRRW